MTASGRRRPTAPTRSRRLAFLAAKTERIKLGTGIVQLAARTPANAAMCAGTVDAMAGGGRFLLGLGVCWPADR